MLSDGYKIYYVWIMLFNENTAIKNVPWSQDIDKSIDLIEIAFPNCFELKYSENSDYHNFSEIVEAFIIA